MIRFALVLLALGTAHAATPIDEVVAIDAIDESTTLSPGLSIVASA